MNQNHQLCHSNAPTKGLDVERSGIDIAVEGLRLAESGIDFRVKVLFERLQPLLRSSGLDKAFDPVPRPCSSSQLTGQLDDIADRLRMQDELLISLLDQLDI